MSITRRKLLAGGGAAVAAVGGAAFAFRRRLKRQIDRWTIRDDFSATPPLLPHDPERDATTIAVAQGQGPAKNVEQVLGKLGGIGAFVGGDDVVAIKVAAQWWNTGMTNVAAAKAVIDAVLGLPGFTGEVVVFENTHFRKDGSGLNRAWTHPSEWNVDVPGMTKLGDLIPHYAGKPVSFVGLIDAGESSLAGDPWWDPDHEHGVYGGDGQGPIAAGDPRDGYFWDFDQTFRLKRSWVAYAQTPLTWPRFTTPGGTVIDLRDGVFRRDGDRLVPDRRRLRFLNVTTCNEHGSTGMTGACKSPMGLVDMSAGALGTHPLISDYQSIHYFGRIPGGIGPTWRMAGPLAFWCDRVRRPDLYVTAAEWVALTPVGFDEDSDDNRHARACAVQTGTVIAGTDPVAIDAWATRNLLHPRAGTYAAMLDLDDPDSKISRFLRYYRQTAGRGTLDPSLVTVV